MLIHDHFQKRKEIAEFGYAKTELKKDYPILF